MSKDGRNLLALLRAELDFLEKGGYRQKGHASWRPQFIFQDSPACLNSDPAQAPKPCSDCVLSELAPEILRRRNVPCRYIPLNEKGETIDYFYRFGTRDELEAALRRWLRSMIENLEKPEGSAEASASEIHNKPRSAAAKSTS